MLSEKRIEYLKNYKIKNKERLSIQRQERDNRNRDDLLLKHKEYYENNKNKAIEYYEENKEKISKQNSKRYELNKEKLNKKTRKYYNENKEKIIIYNRNNKEKIKKQHKVYNSKNKESTRIKSNAYKNRRIKIDPLFKLTTGIRTLIGKSFRECGYVKSTKTSQILGCTFEEFKQHIESKFEPWMNWNNRGDWNGAPKEINVAWDIDHIVPLSTAKTEEDIIKLNHYTNLQPLCSYTNRYIKRNNVLDI